MQPAANDARLEVIDPELIERVRAMSKPAAQFVTLVDALIDQNPRLRQGQADGSDAQRAVAMVAALDVQIQNGGLVQFFWNCPQLVEHVAPALRRIGLPGLAEHFEKAVEQLAGSLDQFIEHRGAGGVDDFISAAEENDFEWFEDLYFGEFERAADRWSGMVEQVYTCSVSFMLENLDSFVRAWGGGA